MADEQDKQYFRVCFREYEGGGPEFRIYNCKNSYHALLKLLAHVMHEEPSEDEFGCVYLGDWGFTLLSSVCLSDEDKIIHCDDDVIRIE